MVWRMLKSLRSISLRLLMMLPSPSAIWCLTDWGFLLSAEIFSKSLRSWRSYINILCELQTYIQVFVTFRNLLYYGSMFSVQKHTDNQVRSLYDKSEPIGGLEQSGNQSVFGIQSVHDQIQKFMARCCMSEGKQATQDIPYG